MPYRVSMRNVQVADLTGGYSENFWNSATSDSAVTTRISDMATKLFNLKGFGANIPSVRVSELTFFRNVFKVFTNLASSPNTGGFQADALTTKILLEMSGDNPKQLTRQWLGSIPDNTVSFGGRYIPTANFLNNLNTWTGVMTGGNGWCMSKQDQTIPKINVASITQPGVLTTIVDHGIVTNDKIRLSRVKNPTSSNGVYRVTKLTNNTLQLIGFVDPGFAITVRDSTTVQKQVRVLIEIRKIVPLRVSSHKVGRPFDLSTGRAKTRRH
jgi:hypothetical protein